MDERKPGIKPEDEDSQRKDFDHKAIRQKFRISCAFEDVLIETLLAFKIAIFARRLASPHIQATSMNILHGSLAFTRSYQFLVVIRSS
jgi:hypothetical protein